MNNIIRETTAIAPRLSGFQYGTIFLILLYIRDLKEIKRPMTAKLNKMLNMPGESISC